MFEVCWLFEKTTIDEWEFSGQQTEDSNIQNTAAAAPAIDCSSLDVFLDGSLLREEEDMSRSTKEWRSVLSFYNFFTETTCFRRSAFPIVGEKYF